MNVASEARPRLSTLTWYVNHVNSDLATVSRRSRFCSHLRRFMVRHDSHLFALGTRGWEAHAFLCLEEGAKPHPGFSAFTSSQSAAKCCKTKTWRSGWRQITYVFWHVITYCKTSLIYTPLTTHSTDNTLHWQHTLPTKRSTDNTLSYWQHSLPKSPTASAPKPQFAISSLLCT